MENEQANLVTISVAAKRLGVSATALRAWHQAGVIPAVFTPGGHRRFDLAVIRDIIFSEGPPHVKS
jgi:excisionase family DNA binding protein